MTLPARTPGRCRRQGTVAGDDNEDFDQFNFTDLPEDQVNASTLSQYDTVVLNEVFTDTLTASQEQAISQFVTDGGKLIIHDADATTGNDYSWLPVPASTGTSCQNCGDTTGYAQVLENSELVSNDPNSPSYVDLSELPGNTDAVGDANVLISTDPRWIRDMCAVTGLGVHGYVGAYASDGGLIIYNGFDADNMGQPDDFPSDVDWLDKM